PRRTSTSRRPAVSIATARPSGKSARIPTTTDAIGCVSSARCRCLGGSLVAGCWSQLASRRISFEHGSRFETTGSHETWMNYERPATSTQRPPTGNSSRRRCQSSRRVLIDRRAEGEKERSALLRRGIGPDAATVAAHDALHGGQPDAGTLELLYGMQALEGAEELVGVGGVEAGAVVAHVVGDFAFGIAAAEIDVRGRMPAGVLPGVAQQVFEQSTQTAGITPGDSPGADG